MTEPNKPKLGRPRKHPAKDPKPKLNYPPKQMNRSKLIDSLIAKLNLSTDAELAKVLGMATPAIAAIRNNKLEVDANILLRMWEVSGFSFRDLRELMA